MTYFLSLFLPAQTHTAFSSSEFLMRNCCPHVSCVVCSHKLQFLNVYFSLWLYENVVVMRLKTFIPLLHVVRKLQHLERSKFAFTLECEGNTIKAIYPAVRARHQDCIVPNFKKGREKELFFLLFFLRWHTERQLYFFFNKQEVNQVVRV